MDGVENPPQHDALPEHVHRVEEDLRSRLLTTGRDLATIEGDVSIDVARGGERYGGSCRADRDACGAGRLAVLIGWRWLGVCQLKAASVRPDHRA